LQVGGTGGERREREEDEQEEKAKPLVDEPRARRAHLPPPRSRRAVSPPGAGTRPSRRAAASTRGAAVALEYCDARFAFACWSFVIWASRSFTETCARRTATLTATTPTSMTAKRAIQTREPRTRRLRRCRCPVFAFAGAGARRGLLAGSVVGKAADARPDLLGLGRGSATAAGANQDSTADI